MARCWYLFLAVFLGIMALSTEPLRAQNGPQNTGIEGSISSSLPANGDPTGFRKWLEHQGITFDLYYTNDVLSNLAGGIKRGTVDQGLVNLQVTTDLEKLVGLNGLTFYWNAFQIHNTGRIRRDYVGGMNTIAAIEATPTTRLSELWLEQKILNGYASIRVGQLAADSEFFFSDLSTMFLQSDWATIAAVNLPSGGPAYPLATPGVRLKVDAGKDASFLFAIFNGDPAGPCPSDPDTCNRYGLNFRLSDPAFMIAEAQFKSNLDKDDVGLARTLKLGAWGHLGQFDDQRYANDGTLLADPAGSGIPIQHRGDFGIYGIIDQQLYRPKGGAPNSGISIYTRASLSPSDRNLVDAYIDGGVVFAGLIPQRPYDQFGAAFIYAHFSDSFQAFQQDQIAFGTALGPPCDYEANLELSYVAQMVPGWTLQPDFQYIWHPSNNGVRSPDAKVIGVRSTMKF